MRGTSRASLASLREQLDAENITSAAAAARLAGDLFAVVGLLDREPALRRALSDPGKPAAERTGLVAALLHGKVTQRAEALAAAAAQARWGSPGDMADAVEQLAIEAMAIAAQADDALDDLEDALFRFGRVLAGQPDLRAALADPAGPAAGKEQLIGSLLSGRVSPETLRLITQMVLYPRGRQLAAALDACSQVVAQRRQQLIAVVRTATELSAAQRRRLARALSRSYSREVHLNLLLDPSVVGGISVQIGDELIDGTAATRLAEVRRKLAG